MGTMTLLHVVQKLNTLDDESTIYALKPWTENSKAMALREPQSGGVPLEAEALGLEYFLEIAIANEFIQDWVASLDVVPSPQQKCLRLIQYAINDA